MPDGMGGAGIGAGGGAIAAAVVYALDKFLGSGKAVRSLDERLDDRLGDVEEKLIEFRKGVGKDILDLKALAERAGERVERLFDWHNVGDPDDPSGKLWYFSVALRRLLNSLDLRISKLLDLLERLVGRFDRYNTTLEKLITVVEKLQGDVNALSVLVAGMDRGDRKR